MTRVDFYLLIGYQTQIREQFACKLTEKVYRLGQQIYIHVEDQHQAQVMDDLLWTFRQGSFVPHGLVGTEEAIESPVLIGHEDKPGIEMNLLINLCSEVPQFFSHFQRVAEIIDQDEIKRRIGREHYRYYRDQGCLLKAHDISI
jgi:DNA polymerase-3 subunit chi